MSEPAVLTETRGAALVVTLNRPASRNAIDPSLAAGVTAALRRLDADPDLLVGVVTGGDSTFCSGMDLRAFRDAAPSVSAETLELLVNHGTEKPVIAAIEGHALGGGFELALACDLIVAAENARLGLPEVRLSLVPSGGGLLRVGVLLPIGVASEMALTGEPQSGARLHELGLVARVAAPGKALDTALELAARIAANGPLAVRAAKALVRDAAAVPGHGPLWALQDEICAEVNGSADAREGVGAFLERRPPKFAGS